MKPQGVTQPVGIWRAIGEFKLKEAVWPEGIVALVVGAGGAAIAIGATQPAARADAMSDVLILAGAFLAVIFTALAIVVSLPSNRYLRMLDETPEGGIRRFLDPFLVGVGTQLAIVLLAVAYRLASAGVAKWIEHIAFGVVGFLFVFGALDIAALARQLVRHGILRAAEAALPEQEPRDGGTLRRLPDRQAE